MSNQIILLLLALPVISGLLFWRAMRGDQRRQFVQQRLHAMSAGRDGEPIPSLVRATSPTAIFQLPRELIVRLDAEFAATGKRIGLLHLISVGLIATVIAIGFTTLVLALNVALVTFFALAAAAAAPVLLLWMAQTRYRNRFLDVFPDALDLIGRGVRAGLPVNEALAAAGTEIADPVGRELRYALDQVQIGVQMIDALQQLSNRVRAADFRFLVVALSLQAKTGGSLAETLANLSKVIRARKALRLKARSLTAEAKASAMVLAVLPFVVGGAMYLMNREMVLTLWFDPRGRFMLGIAVLSLISGLSTMAVIVKRALR